MWRDTPSPYGPLFLVLAGGIAQLGSLIAAIAAFRALAVLGIVLVAVALPTLARRARVPVDRALWFVLACPIVVVLLIGGAHNDALAVGLLVAGFALVVSRHRVATIVGGGVLIGLAMAVKVAVGAALPFAVLLAVGRPAPLTRAGVLRGLAVLGAAVGALVGMSYGSDLDLGWLTALRHSGDVHLWTSPPTGLGLAIGYLGRLFGWHPHPEVATRVIALVVLPLVVLAIAWLARERHRIYGAGLALTATIALAPIFQPWYLVWPLAMFAVTTVPTRWFAVLVVAASFVELPDGNGFSRLVQIPGSLVMAAFVVWFAVRGPAKVRSSFETVDDVTDGDARQAPSSDEATLAR
jgi:alpha-1,6-mannosyltransferase